MYQGMLYTTFIDYIGGFTALIVAWQLQKIRKSKKREYLKYLSYFFFLYGILRVMAGTRILFVWYGRRDIENIIWKWVTGPLTYIHILPGFYYYTFLFFKSKTRRRWIRGIFTIIVIITISSLYIYGYSLGKITYWGSKPVINPITNYLFLFAMFIPAISYSFADFFKRIIRWRRTKEFMEKRLFGFDLGLLIYAASGAADALGIVRNWPLLLVRSGIMASALVVYLFAVWEEE